MRAHNAAFRGLRPWLRHLEASGRLATLRPGVALRYELAAAAKKLEGRQASLFPQPGGHAVPVVAGTLTSRAWIAEAMGVDQDELLARFREACERPTPWREVAGREAPVQQVIANDLDLERLLPLPTHHELDSGAYITAGLVIARNPRTGKQNVSINRLQLSGPDRLGVFILPRHLHAFQAEAERAGADLPCAIVIGADPLTMLASQAIVPLDQDELEVAGALHGAPLDVVKCRTNEVRVPANAEFVIEGRILRGVREPEGPFGEFPKYYGPRNDSQVVAVDAVTHRRDPLFHTIVPAGLEHLLLGGIPREATLLAHLQRSFPNVLDVHLSLGGVCRYHLFVKIRKRQAAEPFNIAMGAFAGHYDVKHVVVVDEDVDVHDPGMVEWAVATRFQAARDLLVVPTAQGSKLDPSSRDGVSSKLAFDATRPLDADEFAFKKIRIPDEEAVDPEALRGTLAPELKRLLDVA